MSQQIAFSTVFNEDSKMVTAIFVPSVSSKLLGKKEENTTFARSGDYYLNISPWGQSFLISLYSNGYILNCLPSAYPSDT